MESTIPEDKRLYQCILCKFTSKTKRGLMDHVRTMKHLQMEQIHQLQKRAEGNTSQTEIGDIFQVVEDTADDSSEQESKGIILALFLFSITGRESDSKVLIPGCDRKVSVPSSDFLNRFSLDEKNICKRLINAYIGSKILFSKVYITDWRIFLEKKILNFTQVDNLG